MFWTIASFLAAMVAFWSAALVMMRWAPPSLGWYPQLVIGASVLYMTTSMTYLLVHELLVQQAIVWFVHLAFALSVLSCWWLTLRVMHLHGQPLRLSRLWTHWLPLAILGFALVGALLFGAHIFVGVPESRDFVLYPFWFAFAGSLMVLCIATIIVGVRRVIKTHSREERVQYFVILAAMSLPLLFGVATAGEVAPVHLMNIGYGFSSLVLIVAVSRGWMDHGLGVSLGLLLESDQHPRLYVNQAMRLVYRNPAALKLFPEARELGGDVLTWFPTVLTTSGCRGLSPRLLSRLVSGDAESESSRPLLFYVRNDRSRWYALESRNVLVGGKPSGCLLSLRDETILEKYREAALSARQVFSLRRLSSSIAHRFNNLMVSVVGNVDLAQYEVENEPMDHHRVRGILTDVKAAGEQASLLAARFAAVGEGAVDQVGLFNTTLDLNELIRDALLLIEHQVPPHITLDVALADVPLMVAMSPSEVTDAVIDLVTNSLEAYGTEAGVIRVSTGRRVVGPEALPDLLNRDGMADGEMAWLLVADHAGGMRIGLDEGLFEPFVTTKAGRQGLGLSAVLASVSAHNGGVDVCNVDGGAAVMVYLPRINEAVTTGESRVTVEPIERDGILLIDDDEAVLQVHAAMLMSLGHNVVPTTSPDAALQQAMLHRFKAAVIDVYMPAMSGVELASRLRLRDPRLPILFIGGYVHEPLKLDPSDRRMAFLPKPFGMDALFLSLEKICQQDREKPGQVIPMPGIQLDR